MKAQDLRIGSLVKCTISNDAGIYTVLAIPDWTDEVFRQVVIDRCPKQTVNEQQIKPILLNEEWLFKFGFKRDFVYKYRYSIGTFVMNHTTDGKKEYFSLALDYGQVLTTQTNYVHQLQNLFHAITGTELEIK